MSELTMEGVMERLERVERELRWWKRLGVACTVALALIVALGATSTRVPDEIRAKRLAHSGGSKPRVTVGQQGPDTLRTVGYTWRGTDYPQIVR